MAVIIHGVGKTMKTRVALPSYQQQAQDQVYRELDAEGARPKFFAPVVFWSDRATALATRSPSCLGSSGPSLCCSCCSV